MAALSWLLFVEIGTASWYRLHERNLISGIRWNVQWPEQAPNFRKLKIDNEIRAILRFDEGDAAAWTTSSPVNAHRAQDCPLFSVRFSVEPGQKQRAFGELASARCMSARKRLEAGGGSWSTQLSHKRFG